MNIKLTIKRLPLIVCLPLYIWTTPSLAADLLSTYKLAEQFDTEIRAAKAEYSAEKQRVPQSRAALLPQVSGTISKGRLERETEREGLDFSDIPGGETDEDQLTYSVNIQQTLFNYGFWQRLKQASSNSAKAEADYNAAKQELIIRVAQAYFNVLAATDALEFAQAEKNSVEQQLEQAKQRFDVGLIAITDVKESQAQYDQAVASEIEARNALSNSGEALWSITNTDIGIPKTLNDSLPLLEPEPNNKQQWVDKALRENLNLLSAKFSRESAEREVNVQRADHYPSLDLTASRGRLETDEGIFDSSEETNIQINLNIPIFQGGGVSARVKEAVYRLQAARERHEASRRLTIQQTRDAYQNVIADISRVNALKQSLISSQAAYEATEAGFEVGTRNSVEVLISLRNTFSAKRDYARTRYDYILNTLRLKQAAGSLSITDIEAINRWLK